MHYFSQNTLPLLFLVIEVCMSIINKLFAIVFYSLEIDFLIH